MPGGGGDRSSRKATLAARERERTIVELWLRGATFEQIGQKLGIDRSTAYKARDRVLKRLPKADIEALRKAQGERLQRMRGKVWSELSSTGDPELINALTGTLLKIETREADLFGLDAPVKQQIVARMFAEPLSEEELDRRLDRLSVPEQHEFRRLLMKMEGRLTEGEPRPIENAALPPRPESPT